jgi:hypothetical protein
MTRTQLPSSPQRRTSSSKIRSGLRRQRCKIAGWPVIRSTTTGGYILGSLRPARAP